MQFVANSFSQRPLRIPSWLLSCDTLGRQHVTPFFFFRLFWVRPGFFFFLAVSLFFFLVSVLDTRQGATHTAPQHGKVPFCPSCIVFFLWRLAQKVEVYADTLLIYKEKMEFSGGLQRIYKEPLPPLFFRGVWHAMAKYMLIFR